MPVGKNTLADRAELLLGGLRKHLSNASSMAFASGTFTPAQVEASIQKLIDLRTAVNAAKVATQAKVAEEKAQAAPLRVLLADFTAFAKVTFSNSPDVLADFGLKPKKARAPLTVDQKVTAVARRDATRKARHTMGTEQLKKVKGTVTTIVTATPSAATPPAVTQQPAAVAPSPGAPAAGATPHIA
jgi:hypothetical protein